MIIKKMIWVSLLSPIAILVFGSGGAQAQEAPEETPTPEEIALECQEIDTGFYTILPQEEEEIPLLAYQSVEFPEETCGEATEKLNNIIANRGNVPLSSLLLRTGTVQSQDVICAVFRTSSGCSSQNMVLNVPAGEVPSDFLGELLATDIEVFSLGNPNQHTRRRTYAQFGQGIERKLKGLEEK